MKKNLSFILLLCCSYYSFSQVGIGTTLPSAQLDIYLDPAATIPALEIPQQTAPNGTFTGQIALIGDKLFMYDATRTKWLSLESTALQYAKNGDADDEMLRFGGNVRDDDSGPKMPFDGTIVYVTAQSSGGETNKQFDLKINSSDIGNNANPTLDGRFNLSGGSFSYSEYNIDFNANDYITVEVRDNGDDIEDPVVVIWIKWRQ
jgi:hypothetical protein